MAILRENIRQDILDKPCECCGAPILSDEDSILTFFRGSFIMLHEKCSDFLKTGQKRMVESE